jgi:hypothetical protein
MNNDLLPLMKVEIRDDSSKPVSATRRHFLRSSTPSMFQNQILSQHIMKAQAMARQNCTFLKPSIISIMKVNAP